MSLAQPATQPRQQRRGAQLCPAWLDVAKRGQTPARSNVVKRVRQVRQENFESALYDYKTSRRKTGLFERML